MGTRCTRVVVATVLVGAGLITTATPTHAAVLTVDTTADTVAADGLTSLREAMLTANSNGVDDEIVLVGGQTYSLTDCVAGPLVYDESADLSITGNGATVTQTCTDQRILEKSGPNDNVLTLDGLTLVTAPNSGVNIGGMAVQATSQLVLDSVVVDGANAGFGGSIIEIDFGAAAFDIVVRDSSITNSTGSAIANQNPSGAQVENSTLTGNTGNGLSVSDGSPIEVIGTTIADNGGIGIVTSGQGFGIQPVATITDSTIDGNDGGGFFCLSSCRTLDVANSFVTNNGASPAPGRGGGLVMPIVLDGGVNPSVTIVDSTISGNSADHSGGGLLVFGTFDSFAAIQPEVSITNSTLSGNTVTCVDCNGGAISMSVGNLTVVDTTIDGNTATGDGGAIAFRRGTSADVTAPSSVSISQSVIHGNTASGDGGGVWLQSDSVDIDQTTVSDNTAGGTGGGISAGGVFNGELVVSGDTDITNSTVSGNTAGLGGGVRVSFPDGSRIDVLNSTVHGNSATSSGGGFLVGPTELVTLDQVTVTQNSAPASANVAANGATTISRSVVAEPLGGGADCGSIVPPAPILVPTVFISGGFNWYDDASCTADPSDVAAPGGDPLLGDLADNGGPTSTRLPDAASPLGGLVPAAGCDVFDDQRGVARPAGLNCEAGSVEVVETLPPPPDGFPAQRTAAGDLRIRGTYVGESFDVDLTGGIAVVSSDADVADPGNPLVVAAFNGPFRDVDARLRGGDDVLIVRNGSTERDVRIDGEAGSDVLRVESVEVGRNADIDGGVGDDDIELVTTNVVDRIRLEGQSGDDDVSVFDANAAEMRVDLGSGDDTFVFAGGVVHLVIVDGRAGNDGIIIAEAVFTGRTRINGGNGDDGLAIFVSAFDDRFRFDGNGGADDVALSASTFNGPAVFRGGGGTDGYVADGATTFVSPPTIHSFP